MADNVAAVASLPYLEQRSEFVDPNAKSRSRLSGRRIKEEALKILRVQMKIGRQPTNPTTYHHFEEPSWVISELPCPSADPAVELPCEEFIQDDRKIPDIYREYQQALFVASPFLELKRIKQTNGGRTPETCEWLLKKGPFRQWFAGTGGQVLHVIGEAHMGKTMLTSFLIERLSTTLRVTEGMILAYHFCDNENLTTNTALSIVKSVLYQLFQQQPQHFHLLQASYDIHKHALFKDFHLMWGVLDDIIQAFKRDDSLFIIVDALDKCDEPNRDLLLDSLIRIAQSSKKVRFLFTSRPVEWDPWAPQAPKSGLASLTIDYRDIMGDITKVLDDDILPRLRAHYRWSDDDHYQVRSSLTNITGTWPVTGIRFLREAQHNHKDDFVKQLVEILRVIPGEEHIDLKRSLSDNQVKEHSFNDAVSTHSLPAYRPKSIASPIPFHATPNSTVSALESSQDRIAAIEALRSNLTSATSHPAASEPFSIVPTPATSRNPSHSNPNGWRSPVSIVEEGEESAGEQSEFGHRGRGVEHTAVSRPQVEIVDTAKDDTSATGHHFPTNSALIRPSPPPSEYSNPSQSEPLFNPAHPVSIFIERAKFHAKDVVFLLLLVYTLRPIWIKVDWRLLVSIGACLAGGAYLAYGTQPRAHKTSPAKQPPTDDEESGTNSNSHLSGSFSAFTSSVIRLFGRVRRRDQDGDESNTPSSPSPPSPSDPNFGFTANEHHNSSGVPFWVIACLIVFTGLGGFAAVAQTIACVRVHDESLLDDYILPTRDDTDHWELLSGSSLLVTTIFLQSAVSIPHVRKNKDAYMPHWICLWVCNGICTTSIPCAWKLYLEWKYVSKAVTGAGNLTQVVVTFLTMLQIVQEKAEKQRHEREKGFCLELDMLRQENMRLKRGKGAMAPPTPPDGDC